jgi:hypothetical protein
VAERCRVENSPTEVHCGQNVWCQNLISVSRVEGWDLQNWRRVWFSDESRFMLQKRNGRTCVYRRRNDRFARNCVLEVDNFGGESVMIWGAIIYARKSQLKMSKFITLKSTVARAVCGQALSC